MYRFIASWFKILGKAGLMGFCKPIQLVKNYSRGTDRFFWGLDWKRRLGRPDQPFCHFSSAPSHPVSSLKQSVCPGGN